MLRKILWFAAIAVILAPSMAHAGRPIDDTVTCPLSNEIISVTQTASCSTMGRRLTLKPITSCDFVTNVPVCPSNNLPLYKDFSETELKALPDLITADTFKKAAELSRFYGAYVLDKTLAPSDTSSHFFILQNGVWEDETLLENKDFKTAYDTAFKAFVQQGDDGVAYWHGSAAYYAMLQDDMKTAEKHMSQMRKLADAKDKYLATYIKALIYCFKTSHDDPLCGSSASIRAHDQTTD